MSVVAVGASSLHDACATGDLRLLFRADNRVLWIEESSQPNAHLVESADGRSGLSAQAEILNVDGSKQWEKSATLDRTEDTVQAPITIEYPAKSS
jgi:hypothetical protein